MYIDEISEWYTTLVTNSFVIEHNVCSIMKKLTPWTWKLFDSVKFVQSSFGTVELSIHARIFDKHTRTNRMPCHIDLNERCVTNGDLWAQTFDCRLTNWLDQSFVYRFSWMFDGNSDYLRREEIVKQDDQQTNDQNNDVNSCCVSFSLES